MPDLDVSDLLLDPDVAQELIIERRKITMGDDGIARRTPVTITPKPIGVILPVDTAIGGNKLERAAEGEYRGSAWEIHTPFMLQGPSPGFDADVVVIEGSRYVVTIVNSLSKYGSGFIRAEVSSMNMVDDPPTRQDGGA